MSDTKTFFRLVIPAVLAFTLSGIYTIVDGFFIGQSLGDKGLASITLGYPAAAVIQAIGTGIGMSGAIRFTIHRAEGKREEPERCFGGTILLMLLVSGLLTALLLVMLNPLLRLLGAEGELLVLTAEYIRVIAIGSVFQLLATGLVPFIRNMGGATFAMAAMMAGFASNMLLDYLYVWKLNWGMAGAAWATVTGQGITLLAALAFFVRKRAGVRLPERSAMLPFFGGILKIAAAPFGLTFSPLIAMILMNRFLLLYGGEQDIAIYSCIGYVVSIVYAFLQGVGDGSQPLISQRYGEKNFPAMKRTRLLAYETALAIIGVCIVGLFLTRDYAGGLFGASPEAGRGVAEYLPFFLATMLFVAFVRITTSYLYAIERSGLSYLLVYAESVLLLGILLILPPFTGILGVWLATPLAQAVAGGIAVFAKRRADRIISMPSSWDGGKSSSG